MFPFILERIHSYIRKKPTCIVPYQIEAHRQLGLTLYRIACKIVRDRCWMDFGM